MINDWINLLRIHIQKSDPSIIEIFEIYASEAKFGRRFIDNNIKELQKGSSILEIGGGSMILSCQLVREGFNVTSVEPTGKGFSHFYKMRKIILDFAMLNKCMPQNISKKAENFYCNNKYDFAFSINVMEHVDNVEKVITNVIKALKIGCIYRFTCPNYLFPYEPHFNIPTLFNKRLTFFFFHNYIRKNKNILDSNGLWKSLNWISFINLFVFEKNNKFIEITYNKKIINEALERIISDEKFSSRRSYSIRLIIEFLIKIKLYKLFSYLPLIFQPIIDCSIKKVRVL